MGNSEFLERIQQYAVRIGKKGDEELYGSGTLFLVSNRKKVCIMSTHEEKVYQIMKRKLDPNFYNTSFIRLDNSEKVVWDKANC